MTETIKEEDHLTLKWGTLKAMENYDKMINSFYDGDIRLFKIEAKKMSSSEAMKFYKYVEKGFPTDKYIILPILQEVFNYELN